MISVDAARSTMQVNLDLTRHAQDLAGKIDLLVRGVVSALFNEIQERTPVDTGFARANWYGGIGAEGTLDASGTAAAAKAGAVIVIVNNAPYIGALEDGWSQQAPEGMVKVTLLNAPQTVEEVAAHVMTMR